MGVPKILWTSLVTTASLMSPAANPNATKKIASDASHSFRIRPSGRTTARTTAHRASNPLTMARSAIHQVSAVIPERWRRTPTDVAFAVGTQLAQPRR